MDHYFSISLHVSEILLETGYFNIAKVDAGHPRLFGTCYCYLLINLFNVWIILEKCIFPP